MNPSTDPAADRPVSRSASQPRPRGLGVLLAAWTVVLVAGFGLVLGVGAPISDPVDRLAAAYAPATPIDEATARESAATIVALEFPEFASFEPSVTRVEDFDIPRWVVVYADPGGAAGVRVSITEADGNVEVSAFP